MSNSDAPETAVPTETPAAPTKKKNPFSRLYAKRPTKTQVRNSAAFVFAGAGLVLVGQKLSGGKTLDIEVGTADIDYGSPETTTD